MPTPLRRQGIIPTDRRHPLDTTGAALVEEAVVRFSAETPIEELVAAAPQSSAILRRFHLVCLQCGEPVWGTLGELAAEKGINDITPILAALEEAAGKSKGGA
jgi:hypothetical protein